MQPQTGRTKRHSSSLFALAVLGALLPGMATPAAAQAADHNWSGFYLGGVLGSSKTDADVHYTTPAAFIGVAGSAPQIDASLLVNRIAPSRVSDRKLAGGILGGYNRQINHLVIGVEAGLMLNGLKAENHVSGISTIGPFWSAKVDTTVKADWMLTLRPRIGYATGRALIYATGGLAMARLQVSQHHSSSLPVSPTPPPSGGYGLAVSETQNKLGWTLGGGVECALSAKWTFKGEYLYTDFGKISTNTLTTDEGSWEPTFPVSGQTFHHTFKVKNHAINFGVNHKF